MNISLTAACAKVAQLQARLAAACTKAYNARPAAGEANAVNALGTVRRFDPRATRQNTAQLDAEVISAAHDLKEAGPAFAFVLSQFPAANEEKFNSVGPV